MSAWRMPWQRRPTDAEIARELQDHIELDAEALRAAGVRDAESVARRRFGNVTKVQEELRESYGGLWIERLAQDLRVALRTLRRMPVFSAVAIACLAIGIGANAAVLSWTDGIVRHPFPGVRDQDRLVAVAGTVKDGSRGFDDMSWPDFTDLARGTTAFSAFIGSKITGGTLTGGDRAERLTGQLVTANFFTALGVQPIIGRSFLPGEDIGQGAHPIVIISYRMWQDRFGGARTITDSTLNLNSVPHAIVGVAPKEFLGTFVGYAMQFFLPASQQGVVDASGYRLEDRTARWIEGFARLAPGVTLAAAQADADVAARRLEATFPNEDRGRGVRILPLSENPFDNAKELKPMLRIASLVAAFVMLIVCANIANLLLVRGLARRPELTVRRALGASRGRLLRQLVTEGLVLAVSGTFGGIAIAYASRNALGLFFPPRNGSTLVFGSDFNWGVLGTTVAIGVASTLIFALVPAVHATRLDLASAMRGAARGAVSSGAPARLRVSLVMVQISLSVLLLVAAGLMTRSLRRMLAADPGFATANVMTTAIGLGASGYDTARAHRFEDDLLVRAREIPGAAAVVLARSIPFATRPYDNGPILVDGYVASADERPTADFNAVTPGFFAALDIPIVEGREFYPSDADTSRAVAIVSKAMAQRYWPGVSPVGKRLQLRGTWMEVVGVAGNVKYRSLTEAPGTVFYVPFAQRRSTAFNVLVRTPPSNAALTVRMVNDAIRAIDAKVSPYEFLTLREQVNRSTSAQRVMSVLLLILGGVALFLAVIGLYGVISYTVSQSTRELGMRMALGATPAELLKQVMSSGLRLALAGVAVGVALALGTTRLLGDLLFEVQPRDPIVIGVVIAIMVVAAALASFVPAWRASRLDPVRALRM